MMNRRREEREWDAYWRSTRQNLLADFYRRLFLSLPMSKVFDRHFKEKGVFVEAGSGSATDTYYYPKRQRRMIAMDISEEALNIARTQEKIDEVKIGSTTKMPFENETVDGIWNLGVMEHLSKDNIDKSLSEFRRVLKKEGRIILLWPAKYNIANFFFWWMFPKMPSLLASRREGDEILRKNEFEVLENRVTIMGDIILVGRKK